MIGLQQDPQVQVKSAVLKVNLLISLFLKGWDRYLVPKPFHCTSPMDSKTSVTGSSIKRVESKEWKAFGIKSLITVPLTLLLVVTAAWYHCALNQDKQPHCWWITPSALWCLNKMSPHGDHHDFLTGHTSCFPHYSCTFFPLRFTSSPRTRGSRFICAKMRALVSVYYLQISYPSKVAKECDHAFSWVPIERKPA